jgi:hypothetical protein
VLAEDPDLAHRLLLAVKVDAGAARRKAPPRRLEPPFDLVNVQDFGPPSPAAPARPAFAFGLPSRSAEGA